MLRRGNVGDRNAAADLGLVAALGDRDVGGQRRAADGAQVEVDDRVRRGTQRGGDARRGRQLDGVALAVAEAQRVAAASRSRGSWPARWPNRCRPTAAQSRRSCAIHYPGTWRSARRDPFRRRRALRLGVPAAPRRRAVLRHARGRARRPDPRSRLRHRPAHAAAAARRSRRRRRRSRARDAGARGGAPAAGWRRASGAARCCCAAICGALPVGAPLRRSRSRRFTRSSTSRPIGSWSRFFAASRGALRPGGWFAFDTFAPNARFLARAQRAGGRRWARTRFRHPATGRATEYSESYRLAGRDAHDHLPLPACSHAPAGAPRRASGGWSSSTACSSPPRSTRCSAGAGLDADRELGRLRRPPARRRRPSSTSTCCVVERRTRAAPTATTDRRAKKNALIVKLFRRKTPGIPP